MSTVYLNGQFLDDAKARISPEDRGFLFADALYEVIRVYGGQPFCAREHLDRLLFGAREIGLDVPFDEEEFSHIVARLLSANGLKEAAVYLQVSRGAEPRQHRLPSGCTPTVYFSVRPAERPKPEMAEGGVKVITHPDIRGGLCYVKTTALLFNCLAATRAKEAGAFEALFVRQGFVTEGSMTSAFCVIDGKLYTHPLANILPGITRLNVLRLAQRHGWEHEERALTVDSFLEADEVFITGTVSEIVPVIRVDDVTIGDGRVGPVTQRVQEAFEDLIAQECGS
ncbi:MAG: D-amino acid aminotransferase [Bacillota bacterium]